jgi:hypothetical protein
MRLSLTALLLAVSFPVHACKSPPDGGYHVCAPHNFRGQPQELYCVILAPEA